MDLHHGKLALNSGAVQLFRTFLASPRHTSPFRLLCILHRSKAFSLNWSGQTAGSLSPFSVGVIPNILGIKYYQSQDQDILGLLRHILVPTPSTTPLHLYLDNCPLARYHPHKSSRSAACCASRQIAQGLGWTGALCWSLVLQVVNIALRRKSMDRLSQDSSDPR